MLISFAIGLSRSQNRHLFVFYTDHKVVPLVLDGTGDAAMRSLFAEPKYKAALKAAVDDVKDIPRDKLACYGSQYLPK